MYIGTLVVISIGQILVRLDILSFGQILVKLVEVSIRQILVQLVILSISQILVPTASCTLYRPIGQVLVQLIMVSILPNIGTTSYTFYLPNSSTTFYRSAKYWYRTLAKLSIGYIIIDSACFAFYQTHIGSASCTF